MSGHLRVGFTRGVRSRKPVARGDYWLGMGTKMGDRIITTKFGRTYNDPMRAVEQALRVARERGFYCATVYTRSGRLIWDSSFGFVVPVGELLN